MTKIRYRDTKEYQELTLEGHAGDSIVCAGISAVSQTLLENLLREETRKQIMLQWTMNTPGQIWMRAWTKDESAAAIRNMFEFTMAGLRGIAEEHPDNLEIREEKENGHV